MRERLATPLRALIVGGGIGGAAAAVALRQAGCQVTILEQANEIANIGAGIQLAPNATRILAEFGALEELATTAVTPQRILRRSWSDGSVLGERQYGEGIRRKYGWPYWHVHRADLHSALLRRATGEHGVGTAAVLYLGTRIAEADISSPEVRVRAENGQEYEGDLVVAADGVHSRLRSIMFGSKASEGLPRGVAYRALIPIERIQEHSSALSSIVGGEPSTTEWLSPKVHFIHYFISGGRYLNTALMRYSSNANKTVESWVNHGDRGEFLGLLDGWDDRLVELAELTTEVFCTAAYHHDPLKEWVRGRACLLGDACHPMLPTQAQGAAQAIEDAWFLGKVLREVDGGGIDRALALYQQERVPRTATVQQLSAVDRGAHLGVSKEESATVEAKNGQPDDFSPYEWLWSYGAEETIHKVTKSV